MQDMPPQELETAVFGKQVEIFWDSRIGQYLLVNTLREYNYSLEKLKTCDPTDFKQVVKLQAEIWRAESFRDWLSQAIEDGIRSTKILEGIDDEIE
jgi:hypothetical protein